MGSNVPPAVNLHNKRCNMRPFIAGIVVAALSTGGCGREIAAPHPFAPEIRREQAMTAKSTEFESFDFDCGWPSSPPTRTFAGNTVHVRDLINYSYHVSSNPLVDGRLTVWVAADINLETGAGRYGGTLELEPTTLVGTGSWVGEFAGHLNGGKFDGNPLTLVNAHIIAQGTGVLEGQSIMFDQLVNPAFEHPDGPAGCAFDGELFKGVILDPRG
jgi:hypothetical protein